MGIINWIAHSIIIAASKSVVDISQRTVVVTAAAIKPFWSWCGWGRSVYDGSVVVVVSVVSIVDKCSALIETED